MITSLLHVNVEYENGLYAVNDKETDVLREIPEEIEILTPFFNEENNLEEVEDTILMENVDDVLITWEKGALSLVLKLARDLAGMYGQNVYIPMEMISNDQVLFEGDGKIILVKDAAYIESALEVGEEISELSVPEEYETSENPVSGCRYFVTMKNGYDAFVSGVYPQQLSNTYAKHILLDDIEADVSGYVDLNSAVFTEEEILGGNEYWHHHLISKEGVRFDNSDSVLKREVLTYHEFDEKKKEGQLTHDHEYILKLESSDDYKAFEKDLSIFEESGYTDTYERRLMDECRFSNECSLKRMLRFSVKNEEIRPCITSEESIGQIGDDYDEIITSASRRFDRTMIDRKCMSCSEHDRCSGCAMLPKGLAADEYCGLMHRHKLIREYIHKQHVASFLTEFSRMFHEDEVIRFSIPGKRFFYPGDEAEKQELFLCEKDGKYYYLNLQTGSLVKVESKFVFLIEAWAAGIDVDKQILNLSLVFGYGPEQSQELVVMGNRKLKNGGMIL